MCILMRYDADIQANPKSLSKWYMYQNFLKSDKKNSNYGQTYY